MMEVQAIVTLVREMRDHNGGVDFIGLTRTGLMNADFEELATAIESGAKPVWDAGSFGTSANECLR